jgi:hypothetical protein
MVDVSAEISALERYLLAGRNADGGWGYYGGKASRLEATCWAALALAKRSAGEDAARVVARWPVRDGLLIDGPAEPNYAFHGVALIALQALGLEHAAGNATLIRALERARGAAARDGGVNRQDNSLRAWSWIPDTFTWVEPTAWCLLALKKSRARGAGGATERIGDGEAVLMDRCCADGGWNYGNSNMLGRELHPYVSATAIALLAMQDRAGEPAIARSLDFLERRMLAERSGFALSLTSTALRVLGRPREELRDAIKRQVPMTLRVGNHVNVALSLYALRTDHGDAAFRL